MKEELSLRLYELAHVARSVDTKAAALVKAHEAALVSILEKLGFSGILRPSAGILRSFWAGAPEPGAPHLRAMRNGRKACLYFGDAAESILGLTPMPQEAYDYADAHIDTEDVYYGAFIMVEEDDGSLGLKLLGFALMRSEGAWRDREPESHQFIPFAKRPYEDTLSPMVGGAAFVKLEALASAIRRMGQPLQSYINGLCPEGDDGSDGIVAYGVLPSPMLTIAGHQEEGGPFCMERMLFMSDKDPVSELELVGLPPEDDASLLKLMDETGREFCADCLEALLLRSRLRCGQRFLWTLSLVAERCEYNTQEFTITEGAFFEMEKKRYEEEHGEPAPADYALHMSTAEMRQLQGHEDSSHAFACGVVESVEELSIGFADM